MFAGRCGLTSITFQRSIVLVERSILRSDPDRIYTTHVRAMLTLSQSYNSV